MELLSGVVVTSTTSFDDGVHSFQSPEGSETEDTLIGCSPPLPMLQLRVRAPTKLSTDSQDDSQFESPEEDTKSASSLDILDTQSDSACSMDKVSPDTVTSDDLENEVRGTMKNSDSNNNFAVNFAKFKESGLSHYYQNIITKQVMLVSNN